MVANRQGMQVRPGSMGKPLSYIEADILDRQGNRVPVGEQGLLCFRANWGSMFRDYLNKRSLYEEKFIGEYYLTGDLAWQDRDGYFWYVGRADDVINTAGHLVGPFEIESALLEVPDIADVAVIGVPDPILHERILAFVCVRKGVAWSKELELNCRVNVSNRVSSVAIPQEFRVVDKIPKNKSGKILRRVLKAWYQGIDPGDLSTMEE
jgi:acetyl-CoA synthetase